MAATREQSSLSTDLACAAALGSLLLLGGWTGLVRPSPAKAELARVSSELDLKRRDLVALERESSTFSALLREREAELAGAGTPQARSPIEEDLRTLTELMRRNNLHVAEVSPLGTAAYPGVLESKYRLRASGGCADIARAFRDFENCAFWGDITHLQIGDPGGAKAAAGSAREADITLSFYSASIATDPPTTGTKP